MRKIGSRTVAVAIAVVAAFVAISTAPDVALQEAGIVQQLAGMSGAQIDTYLAKHPDDAVQVANADPAMEAEFWNSLSKDGQDALLQLDPEVFGNMDGVPYAARDKANRIHLASALKSAARQLVKTHSTAAKLRLASLQAIQKTLASKAKPHRYLVTLTDDTPALAAISIGNLDTAKQVTFAVPGMGTYTTDMQLWTQAAQNIYDEQGAVGAPAQRAVVSWIGYVTPPQGIEASRGIYAQAGAPRLNAEIGGLLAVRAKDEDLVVNVVAHSYGTTTAADALFTSDFRVYAFVMVGSAGIETTIPSARALHAEHVYAAEAAKDPLARFGRESRTDPRSAGFGATVFPVNGVPGNDELLPVTGHEPILHSAWNDDPDSTAYSSLSNAAFAQKFLQHLEQYGYLDNGTESLYNIAVLATPGTADRVR